MTIPTLRSSPVALPVVARDAQPIARGETASQGKQSHGREIQPSLDLELARREANAAPLQTPRKQAAPVQPVLNDLAPSQANALRSYLQAQYIDRQVTVSGSELLAGIDIFV